MWPVVHGLEAQYGEQIDFVYVNVDDPGNRPLMQALGRRGQPHFILLDGEGAKVTEWFGRVPEGQFTAAFDQVLSDS